MNNASGASLPSTAARSQHLAPQRAAWLLAVSGFLLGLLVWYLCQPFNPGNLLPVYHPLTPVSFGLAGAGIGATRFRPLLWIVLALLASGILILSFTPLIDGPVQWLVRPDPLQQAPAVLALCTSVQKDGAMDAESESRFLGALQLVRQGYASRLLFDHFPPPKPSPAADIQRQIRALSVGPIAVEDLGPVESTHDEAVAAARLVRARHWTRLLVVTSPTHTTRVHAVFTRAGVPVLVRPCEEHSFDLQHPNPGMRLAVFRAWLHEKIGLWIYRRRGWV